MAYNMDHLEFGRDYMVSRPFDHRGVPAVAKAAMESGVSRLRIDMEQYRKQLEKRLLN